MLMTIRKMITFVAHPAQHGQPRLPVQRQFRFCAQFSKAGELSEFASSFPAQQLRVSMRTKLTMQAMTNAMARIWNLLVANCRAQLAPQRALVSALMAAASSVFMTICSLALRLHLRKPALRAVRSVGAKLRAIVSGTIPMVLFRRSIIHSS